MSGRYAPTQRTSENGALRTGRMWSPETRKNAQSIFSRSVERMRAGAGERRYGAPAVPRQSYSAPALGGKRRYVAPTAPGQPYNAPSWGGGRRSVSPGPAERSYNGPVRGGERRYVAPTAPGRPYNAPSWGGERPFGFPGAPARQFNGPVFRGGPVRSLAGNGWPGSSRFGQVFPNRGR